MNKTVKFMIPAFREELGVEPGTSLTPTAVPVAPSPQCAESLDAEVQLGTF